MPENSELEIDVTKTKFLDNDIIEIIDDFLENSEEKQSTTRLISERGTTENPKNISELLQLQKAS